MGLATECVPAPPARLVSVCDYVAAPLEQVQEVLETPDVDQLLTALLEAALDPDTPDVSIHAAQVERVSRTTARTRFTWHVTDAAAPDERGDATLALHVVSSGREPLTELVLSVPVADPLARQVSAVAHRFLGELTGVLQSRAG